MVATLANFTDTTARFVSPWKPKMLLFLSGRLPINSPLKMQTKPVWHKTRLHKRWAVISGTNYFKNISMSFTPNCS